MPHRTSTLYSMRERLARILALAELARAELAAAAIGNTWLMLMLGFALEPERVDPRAAELGEAAALGLAAVMAVGVVVCAMALNDVLDVKHDRAFAPDRALPSGRLSVGAAVTLAMVSLLVGLSAAWGLGQYSTLAAVVAGAGVLFYNLAGRYVPAVGAVSLGLVTAVLMLAAHPRTGLTWPIVLAMTHAMAAGALRQALSGRRPRWQGADTWLALAGWAFWTLLVVTLTQSAGGATVGPAWMWVGPAVAAGGYAVAVAAVMATSPQGRSRARRVTWLGGWWMMVLAAGWLAGARLWGAAGVVLLLAAASAGWGGLMRWLASRLDPRPVRYRLPAEDRPGRQGRAGGESGET